MRAKGIAIRRTGRTWGVFENGQIIEGGFFNRAAAEDLRDELLREDEMDEAAERGEILMTCKTCQRRWLAS